jgi:endo-1,4-beta-xylanase
MPLPVKIRVVCSGKSATPEAAIASSGSGLTIAAAVAALLPIAARQNVALKDLMADGMVIGVAINQRQSDLVDTAAVEIITKQFNQITPENLLKFQHVHPVADHYAFEAQDRYVRFGRDRKMQIVGHTLVWHRQTPVWVFQGADGKPADRETLLARMRDHIHTVVGRYKGKIHGWDVVNEAIDEDGTLRKAPWREGIGDAYVAKAFEFAHQAEPDAELYYNDYNLEKPAKRAGVIRLVKDLRARGLRIDGIGNQAHWQLETPAIDQIEQTLAALHGTGLKVMYTELDINMLPPAAQPKASQPSTALGPSAPAEAGVPGGGGRADSGTITDDSYCRWGAYRFVGRPRTFWNTSTAFRISSIVPSVTRLWVFSIGGKSRPTATPSLRQASLNSLAGRPRFTKMQLVWQSDASYPILLKA